MKIPNQLRFMSHVIEVNRLTERQHANNSSGTYNGWYNLMNIVDIPEAESMTAETLMHEILEMIVHKLSIELPHDKLILLSEAMFHVIRENGLQFHDDKYYPIEAPSI